MNEILNYISIFVDGICLGAIIEFFIVMRTMNKRDREEERRKK